MSVLRLSGVVIGSSLQSDGVTTIITISSPNVVGGTLYITTTNAAQVALYPVGTQVFADLASVADQALIAAADTVVNDGTLG